MNQEEYEKKIQEASTIEEVREVYENTSVFLHNLYRKRQERIAEYNKYIDDHMRFLSETDCMVCLDDPIPKKLYELAGLEWDEGYSLTWKDSDV